MAIRKPASATGANDVEAEASRTIFRAAMRKDGSVTVPEEVRRLMKLERGGEVEMELTMAGLILRPMHEGRGLEQWWYWTDAWQEGEREADAEMALGENRRVYSSEEFLAELDSRIDD